MNTKILVERKKEKKNHFSSVRTWYKFGAFDFLLIALNHTITSKVFLITKGNNFANRSGVKTTFMIG